jgi:hypothetical protein
MLKCSQCGGTKFEQGSLYGFDALRFQSVSGSGLNIIPVAYMCQNCSHIEIFASPQKNKK